MRRWWSRGTNRPEAVGRGDRQRRRASSLCLVAVLLLAVVVVGLHVRDDGRLSPVDETQHVDYLDRARHLQIPRLGEFDGAVARHEVACRGVEANFTPPPCAQAATAPNSAFPEDALDTAAADPPLYYAVTGIAARVVQAGLHLGSLVTAARLLGAAWLAAALIVLWLAMGEFGVGLVARTAVAVLMVTTPTVILSSATVTSDATVMLAGAASLYAVVRWERGAAPAWVVLVIAALCPFAKVTALAAVGATSVYLLVRWLRARRDTATSTRTPRGLIAMAVAGPVAGLAVAVAWQFIVVARTIPGVPTSGSIVYLYAAHLTVSQVFSQVAATLSPLQNPTILAPLHGPVTVAIAALVNALVVAAAFGGAAFAAAGSRLEALAGSAAALMLVSGPLLAVFIYVGEHAAFDIPARYGLALVPFGAVALAAALHRAPARFAVVAFAAAVALFTVVTLAAFHPV